MVEEVTFDSGDPAFAGIMTITTSLSSVVKGTEVTISYASVPPGIGKADHLADLASTLENLARYCTRPA